MIRLFNDLSVKFKIAISFAMVFLVVVIFILIFFPARQRVLAQEALKDKGTSIANMLATNIAPAIEFDDTTSVINAFTGATRDEDLEYIAVFDNYGNLFASYNFYGRTETLFGKKGVSIQENLMIISVPVTSGEYELGKLILGMSLERINKQISKYRQLVLLMGIIILLLGGFAGLLMGGTITKPIQTLLKRTVELSKRTGDLTAKVPISSKDEVGELGTSFNNMIDGLRGIIEKVLLTANEVSEMVKQLSSSSQDINATLQEVSSTVQEISAGSARTAQQVSETSRVVEEMTSSIVSLTQDSQAAVEKMNMISETVTDTMNVINQLAEHSSEIQEFVKIISDIANQTNLLALNASIEAARAGEAGRGFTVVAEEVKKLAEDSAEAADQIGHLINDIISKIDAAVNNMKQSTKTVQEGKTVITDVSTRIQDIMAAGAKDVEDKISEISAMSENAASATEETSAATEEIASSMEQMTHLIQLLITREDELRELVGRFKVAE
ncbi:hypothetical protein DRQ33_08165 [bacterium]|nr:MAG: hypothetical protein DRQ33_08165 [bacterium]